MGSNTYEIVDSVDKLEQAIARTKEAQKVFATYTQEQVDKISLLPHPLQTKQESVLPRLQ